MTETALYPTLASALTLALAGAYVFLGVAEMRSLASRKLAGVSRLARHVPLEVGHDVRQRLRVLDQRYGAYLGSFLVFFLLLLAIACARPTPLPFDIPQWSWAALAILVALISLHIPVQALRLYRARRRLAFVKDAHVVVGFGLQRVARKGNVLFHDVRIGKHTLDNVVVGTKGVYAVSVVARPASGDPERAVRLNGRDLHFGNEKDSRSVVRALLGVQALGKELGQLVGDDVRIQSVIAVPGWQIGSSGGNGHLLVNEKTVVTLTGWTHSDAYLMNEDADKICRHLARLCHNGKRAAR